MKTTKLKKLRFDRETLRALTPDQARRVHGGAHIDSTVDTYPSDGCGPTLRTLTTSLGHSCQCGPTTATSTKISDYC
jgi:hypothetical protein